MKKSVLCLIIGFLLILTAILLKNVVFLSFAGVLFLISGSTDIRERKE